MRKVGLVCEEYDEGQKSGIYLESVANNLQNNIIPFPPFHMRCARVTVPVTLLGLHDKSTIEILFKKK